MSGYLRVQRDRFGHKLFRASKTNPFCRGYAWDWMIAQACWRATTYDIRGKTVTVERGQFVASPDEMAEAWGWARTSVQRFLSRLQTDHMIGQETGHNKTIITICNYNKYQVDASESGQESGRNSGHKAGTKRAAKERREEGEEKEEGKKESARDALAGVVGEERAAAFIAHRKALRAPMTPHAGKLLAKKLAAMSDPGAAVDRAIERGWKRAFDDDSTVTPFRGKPNEPGLDDYLDAFKARLAVQRLE
jgi:hypothetical protein